jgi:nucleoside-diphosphate-sugar epimerase
MKEETILLTGSTGMLGQNIIKNNKKYKILAPSKKQLNLLNYQSVFNYIKKNKPTQIIHAAAIVGGIKFNVENQIMMLNENIKLSHNLIMCAFENKVKKLLNVSSSCIYPPDAKSPLKEECLLTNKFEPTNEGYAISKVYSMKLCQFINEKNKNFKYKTIIPCNLYGRYEKFDLNKSHLISAAIKKIYQAKKIKNKKVEVWGSGNAKREFLYVEDFVDFIFFSLNNFVKLPNVINCGYGEDFKIKTYYDIISRQLKFKGSFFYNKAKPEGQKKKLLDVTKQTIMGWKPKYSLNQGILRTITFFLSKNTFKRK